MRSAIVRSNIPERTVRGGRRLCSQLRTIRVGPSAGAAFPPSNHYYPSTSTPTPTPNRPCLSRWKSTLPEPPSTANSSLPRVHRTPVVPFELSPPKPVPSHIPYPPYVTTGQVDDYEDVILLHDTESITKMRAAAQLARRGLDVACGMAVRAHEIGRTTDDIDTAVHNYLINAGAYPSPLHYSGFPKSICSSVNEVICHGIPDQRPLQFGDVVSFDVSCYLGGVHGDNCATVIVGDCPEDYKSEPNNNNNNSYSDPYFVASRISTIDDRTNTRPEHCDWRGTPYRTEFATPDCEAHFVQARRLVQAARDCLYESIATVHPGSCLTEIGRACDQVAYRHGFQSVRKYRGHGIASDFHIPPFVKHYTNVDFCQMKPGMIFTIEPMIAAGNEACFEWKHDDWTVATVDGSLAAQFEHTVLVTPDGVEILTLPS